MALIVEDGTIVAGADSFLSLAEARSMATNYGLTLPDDDTEAEVVLRQGYLMLNKDEKTLQGSRISPIQTGIVPRNDLYINGFLVANNVIPVDVKMAQLNAGDAINAGVSTNSVDTGQKLASFTVEGVYSETYQDDSKQSTNSTIQGVYNALYPLTKAAAGGSSITLGRECMGYL